MTEPPQPRRPEEGGGEDWEGVERDAIRDFVADHTPDMQEAIDAARAEMGDEAFDAAVEEVLRRANAPREPQPDDGDDAPPGTSEWFDELDDDVLLDQLGSGEAPDEWDDRSELRDMLETWRDEVDSEPVGPIAERAQEIHDFNDEVDRATRPPGNGGTNPMSQLSELANAVAGNADVQEVLAAIAQAAQVLQDKKTAVMALLADTNHAGAVEGAFGAAEQAIDGALGPVNQVGEAINAAAGAIRGG